jgi:hypothetical protein
VHILWISVGPGGGTGSEQAVRYAQGVEENFSTGVSAGPVAPPRAQARFGCSADGGHPVEPATLRHVDSGEWRYGQAGEPSGGPEPPQPNGGPPENLWTGEPAAAVWGASPPWVPEHRSASTGEEPDTGGWQRGYAPADWGQARHSAMNVPAPALPQLPVMPPGSPTGPPGAGAAGVPGLSPTSPAGYNPYGRTGLDTWSRPEGSQRRRITEDEEFGPHRSQRNAFGDEPAYGPVLGYTAGWYGIPALFYLVWLFTLDDDRQGLVGRQLVASLPWLLAAVVLSLAVAGLLRWAIIGWRAITLSFAAAVIGAGVTTIAHSLTL